MKDADSREFQFTTQDFERVRKMIYDHAGISLSDSKQEMVYSRLSRRLRATGIQTFGAYLNLLEQNDEQEWEAFINSLTTNLTSFFRERIIFRCWPNTCCKHARQSSCRDLVFRQFHRRRTLFHGDDRHRCIRQFQSAGDDPGHRSGYQRAGDGRKGVYPIERVEKLDDDRLKRFFLKGEGESCRVRQGASRIATHDHLPAVEPAGRKVADPRPLDAIFCRNVMIYFDKQTQLAILKKFAPLLREDGLMFAGHSENFYHAEAYFKLRGKTVYELSPTYQVD